MRKHFAKGAVVQLVRIPACHAGGRGFESRPLRQHKDESLYSNVGAFFVLASRTLLNGESPPQLRARKHVPDATVHQHYDEP